MPPDMVAVRWLVRARPGTEKDVAAVLGNLLAASRAADGVVSFDLGRAIDDPSVFVATEVFEDRSALDGHESLQVVEESLQHLEHDLGAEMESTLYRVTNAAPWGAN